MTPPRAPASTRVGDLPSALLLVVPSLIVIALGVATPAASFAMHQGDVALYLSKAEGLAHGLAPYRDFPLEYPPFALVSMVVPYLLALPFGPVSIDTYRWTFLAWEAALLLGLALVLVRIAARLGFDRPARTIAIRLIVLSAGAGLVLAWRYDLLPALLAAVAVWGALADRPGAAGLALGAGILAKLFPIVLAPALAARWLFPLESNRAARFGLAAVLSVLVGFAPFVFVAGTGALTAVQYTAARGLNIESIGGGLVILGGLLAGQPVPFDAPFSSIEVLGPGADLWLAITPLLTAAGFGVLGLLGLGRIRADLVAEGAVRPASVVLLATASMLVLLATSKVFSIQYVVWLLPLAVLLPSRRFALAAGILALTMPIHPILYGPLIEQEAVPVLLLNVRNALVLVLLVSLFRDMRSQPR